MKAEYVIITHYPSFPSARFLRRFWSSIYSHDFDTILLIHLSISYIHVVTLLTLAYPLRALMNSTNVFLKSLDCCARRLEMSCSATCGGHCIFGNKSVSRKSMASCPRAATVFRSNMASSCKSYHQRHRLQYARNFDVQQCCG